MRSSAGKAPVGRRRRGLALHFPAVYLRPAKLDLRILDPLAAEPECDRGPRDTARQEPSGARGYRAASE